jgi:hypothetical protein
LLSFPLQRMRFSSQAFPKLRFWNSFCLNIWAHGLLLNWHIMHSVHCLVLVEGTYDSDALSSGPDIEIISFGPRSVDFYFRRKTEVEHLSRRSVSLNITRRGCPTYCPFDSQNNFLVFLVLPFLSFVMCKAL